jgi:PPK2 family polyphosphate:nucleotide phosphotransferase
MKFDMEQYRVKPGAHIRLASIDPEDIGDFDGDKDEGKEALDALNKALEDLQERLYSEHKKSILIILQGMDTSGKDGTIEHVFEGVNPQGVRVASFKAPTPIELEHDFLWRVHQKAPGKGEIVIFNRSHYEDVLIVRVHELVPEKVWSRRYAFINDFERLLSGEGTIILKFFLHINQDEQERRFLDRLADPAKHWKFNPDDLKERKHWDRYMHAYEDALSMTSTEWAPWYIVPANRKWFRNLVIASVLVDAIKKLNPQPVNLIKDADIKTYREALEKE